MGFRSRAQTIELSRRALVLRVGMPSALSRRVISHPLQARTSSVAPLYSSSKTDSAGTSTWRLLANSISEAVWLAMVFSSRFGNFALASAQTHDGPAAISQVNDALQLCGKCSALPLLHKDLGLIYCHSGDFKNGRGTPCGPKTHPGDADITKALND